MSYQVLARKWRPRTFASLVGQEHVVRALTHALQQQRLHHAYLFTGTRGVGKTTIARILAKSLNCETGITATPCGTCSACTEIDAGRFIDLLEVDAATNTRVDEMRQLLENAVYAPTRGRFKVYVIDEVHMLSNSAFNAMLKTLEEPPAHVKFVLATTDPQKIPVTVLSRCLQFNLKRLPVSVIAARLTYILKEEGIAAEPAAVRLVATAADGSLRDALSLLDQLLAFGSETLKPDDVHRLLGTAPDERLVTLAEALMTANAPAALAALEEALAAGVQVGSLSDQLIEYLRWTRWDGRLPMVVRTTSAKQLTRCSSSFGNRSAQTSIPSINARWVSVSFSVPGVVRASGGKTSKSLSLIRDNRNSYSGRKTCDPLMNCTPNRCRSSTMRNFMRQPTVKEVTGCNGVA